MAANAAITCPSCTKKFKTKADVRGKRIRCPFCTESFSVPMVEDDQDEDEEGGNAAKATDGAKPQPAGVPAGADGEEGDDPYAVTHLDIAPRCPNCAHEMPSAEAVVCLNCGYNTLTREWGKTEKTIGVSFGRHMVYLMPGFLAFFALLGCLIERLAYAIYLPFMVAGVGSMDWMDHESLRMWGAMVALFGIFFLGRYCFNRFIVKPLPEEIVVD